MDKITRILRPGESPFIAPRACYAWFDRDHVRRSQVLPAELDESQQLIREIAENLRDGATDYTPWVMLSQRVIEAENFVREILESHDTGFEDQRDDQGRLTELVCLPLGRYYFRTLMSGKFLTDIDTLEPYRLRPMAQVYFDVRHGPQFDRYGTRYFKSQPWFRLNDGEPFRFEMFNDMVHAIRAEAEARNLDGLDEWNESQAKQRFKAMMHYLHWCFRKRRRIFAIRMDLYYRSEFADKVSIEQVKEHHALFVNRLRALKDIHQLIVHEVIAPNRIGLRGAWQAYVVAATTSARTSPRNVELQGSPHSPHPRFAQRQPGRHPAIAEARHFLRGRHQPLA